MKLFLIPRALLIFSRPLIRIAKALEDIRDLYRLHLQSQGIYPLNPDLKDEVEVVYGPQPIKSSDMDSDPDSDE